MVARTIDRLDRYQASAAKTEDNTRVARQIAPHHDAFMADQQARDLKFEFALIAPEPGYRTKCRRTAHDTSSDVASLVCRVLDGFQTHDLLCITGWMRRAIANRTNVGICGEQAIIDHDAVAHFEVAGRGQLDIRDHSDADDDEISGNHLALDRFHPRDTAARARNPHDLRVELEVHTRSRVLACEDLRHLGR